MMLLKNKKTYFSLIALLAFSLSSPAIAIDDWGSVYESYNEATYEKVITGQEFEKAIDTIQNHGKKKKDKDKKKFNKPKKQSVNLDMLSSKKLLFTLPQDVYYQEQVIPQGFYLVSSSQKNGKYFFELSQDSRSPIVSIEANSVLITDIALSSPEIEIKTTKDNLLKINYSYNNKILEVLLIPN